MLSKWFLSRVGRLRPVPVEGRAEARIVLPEPGRSGGMPLMQALALRRSERELADRPLSRQQLADLLWAADGINRPEVQEHTAPSAMNAQEIEVYVALAEGLFLYDARTNSLELVAADDARRVTGLQEFVDHAPLDLVYVANHERMTLIPESRRAVYSAICAGAIAQNVYLCCASAGLASVVRGLFDETALAAALGLRPHQHILLTQTVGHRRA